MVACSVVTASNRAPFAASAAVRGRSVRPPATSVVVGVVAADGSWASAQRSLRCLRRDQCRPCRPPCRMRRSSRAARRGSPTAGPPPGRRCRRTGAARRSTSFGGGRPSPVAAVGARRGRRRRVLAGHPGDLVGQRLRVRRPLGRDGGQRRAVGGGGVAAAASLAQLAVGAGQVELRRELVELGGGGGDPHAAAVTPSSCQGRRPEQHASPADGRRGARHAPSCHCRNGTVYSLDAAARLRLARRPWRIVDSRFQVALRGIVSGQLKMRSSP